MSWTNEDIVNRLQALREWYLAMMAENKAKEEQTDAD